MVICCLRDPVLIADEFVLLALYSDFLGWPVGSDGALRVPAYLRAGVSVALLAELAISGVVTVKDNQVVATGREVRGDDELRELATRIAADPKSRTAEWWGVRLAAEEPELRRLTVLRERGAILA